MDGENTPYVWISGYEVHREPFQFTRWDDALHAKDSWRTVSCLFFDRGDRSIMLGHDWPDRCHSLWAVPSFVPE